MKRKLTLEQKINRRQKINRTAMDRIGDSVKSIDRLAELAKEKKSIYAANCWGLIPAIAVMNMAACRVYSAIKDRRIYEYNPGKSN